MASTSGSGLPECAGRCFHQHSVADIVRALHDDGSEWAKHTLTTLHKMSPTAVKVTFEQVSPLPHTRINVQYNPPASFSTGVRINT